MLLKMSAEKPHLLLEKHEERDERTFIEFQEFYIKGGDIFQQSFSISLTGGPWWKKWAVVVWW